LFLDGAITDETSVLDPDTLKYRVASVFAIASFVEMCERWSSMPVGSQLWTTMVCNHSTLDIRGYGRLVYEERELSAKPMFDHLCSMCGCLLSPWTHTAKNPKEVGIAGLACQVHRLLLWPSRAVSHL
jgi:hypothetical protein